MSLPFDNELQRQLARVRRRREGGQHTELSTRMDTPTLSTAGVGSPILPPPFQDISSMTDMVTELSRPVDRAQLDQEIEDFNLTYPVNVDDALNAFTLPPVAGTGTAPATTTTAPPRPPPPPPPPPQPLKPVPPRRPEVAPPPPPPDDPDHDLSTTTTPRPWPWPSTWTGSTPVKKDIKTASFLPLSQYHVWPMSKRDGP